MLCRPHAAAAAGAGAPAFVWQAVCGPGPGGTAAGAGGGWLCPEAKDGCLQSTSTCNAGMPREHGRRSSNYGADDADHP
eukprot:1157426-Pelagomonas_calceolata.AAC.3